MYDKSTVIYNKVTGVYKSVTLIPLTPDASTYQVTPTKYLLKLKHLQQKSSTQRTQYLKLTALKLEL